MTMKSVDLPHLRSVVLAGHAGAGKTTLAEQLLFKAGAIPRLGRVDDGTAHLDFEPEEQKRRESLSLAVGTFEHDGTRISLVDTPGYPDFVADMVEGFAAVDGVLFVMDASAGVESGLEHAVALGRAGGRAACFFINKCDRENADPGAALDALRSAFGDKIAPLQIAIGAAEGFSGYVDLVHRKAYRWDGTQDAEIPIPDDLVDEVARRRDQLLAAAAEADDDVLVKYLDGEEVSDPELEACLRKGVKESILAPVLVGSAAKGIGLRALLDAFTRYLPSPADEPPTKATDKSGATVEIGADEAGPLLVRVFKTTADPFVGRLTYLRVLSGTLKSQAHVWNATRDEDERIGQLLLLHGKEQEPIGELKAGEIGAVAKLAVTETGDTLGAREKALVLAPLDFPAPSLVVAIEPVTKQDLDKMGPALARLLEEDPTVRLERTAVGEQVLRTMGEAHTAVILERLKRKFGAAIATHMPKVPYKETIRGTTKVHGRYKKQTGGHGMFGDVWLELEPNPDGGIEFTERIVGGSVPKGFFPGVEKGIREAAAEGVLAGYPLSDFKATLFDGSFHTVDSNELSFKIAASMALKDGVQQAKPALLEPIMLVEVRVPEAYMGEVNRDLNGRRGRVLGLDSADGMQVITAHVPQAELFDYATELRSLAQGRGSFTASLDHYEDVPSHVAEKVIADHRKAVEATGHGGH
ncbi:MAG TPA: elongation factor G [Candidatus Limnocylindrales bacterium]|jgi:elongation factor G|nr:elongation factor G [Candidatus Limnocylindrales bacterium]